MMEESIEDIDWDTLLVKGTSEALEKSYFRLTSAPDPSTVRPEPVLEKALARLVGLIRAKSVSSYFYIEDQFKGMRQDCTVQHLRSELTGRIYEAHARAALEYGDFAGYNQVLGATIGLRRILPRCP
jgi:SAC3 family protein LENG8/THP3